MWSESSASIGGQQQLDKSLIVRFITGWGRTGSCDQSLLLLLVVSNSWINLLLSAFSLVEAGPRVMWPVSCAAIGVLSALSLVEAGPGHVTRVVCFYWWSTTVGWISYCQIYHWLRPDRVMWSVSCASIGGQQQLDRPLPVSFITVWDPATWSMSSPAIGGQYGQQNPLLSAWWSHRPKDR